MALVPDHYAKNRHLVPLDAVYELRRARERVGNKPDDMIRHIVDSATTDEVYKHVLLSLLTVDGRAVPGEGEMRKSAIVEYRVRPAVGRKRKRNQSIVGRQDGRDRGGISEKNKLLCVKKETGVIENSVKKEKQCENGVSSKKALDSLGNDDLYDEDNKANVPLIHSQGDFIAQARPAKTYGKQVGGKLKGVVKEEYPATILIKNQNKAYVMVKKENEANVVVKKENEANVVVKKENEIYQDRTCRSRNCVRRNHCKDVGQVQLVKKDAARGGRGLMEVNRGDNGLASKKIAFGNSAVKKEPEDCVETRRPVEGIHSPTRNGKCAKYSTEYKNSNEKYLEGRVSSNSVPEVEILDNDMVVKAGIFSPFIPSTKFDSSVYDEKSKDLGLPSAKDEFRMELLKILRKPYDKEEHQKLRETIKAPYLKHNRGLQKKLRKCRYKREKRLVLLRGFSFWLQNVSREGAFKPWKDEECLAVEIS